MKCGCVVSGHCARIELSLYLSVRSIGSTMVMMTVVTMAMMTVVVVVVAVATIKVQAITKAVQVGIPVADASLVPVVQCLVPVHLKRWAVVAVVAVVVVVAAATIKVQATGKAVQVVVPVADASFVPVVQSPVPVHLERYSFQRTHSQILPHSKH